MSYFKAKMHQIQFPPQTPLDLQHSPDPLAEFKGPTSKEREGRVGEGRGGKGKGGHPLVLAYTP